MTEGDIKSLVAAAETANNSTGLVSLLAIDV